MDIIEVIKKISGKYFVYSHDGKKKLGGPYESRDQAVKRLQQVEGFKHMKESDELVWEAQDLKSEITESEGKPKLLHMSGVAVTEGVSKNGVRYSYKNLEENNGLMFNVLVGHRKDYDNPDHNVGEGTYHVESNKLKFGCDITNNVHHSDIIEQVQKQLVSVSVQGKASIHRDGDEVVVESLNIPLLCLVNKHTRGIEGATIESAIAERLEICKNDEDKIVRTKEAIQMSEENATELIQKQLNEKDEKLSATQKQLKEVEDKLTEANKGLEDAKKKKELEDAAKKAKLAKGIVEMNKTFKEEELMEKTISELEIIQSYEKKIKESTGSSEIEEDEDVDEALKGIIVEKRTGFITLEETARKKFNDDLMNSIYRK